MGEGPLLAGTRRSIGLRVLFICAENLKSSIYRERFQKCALSASVRCDLIIGFATSHYTQPEALLGSSPIPYCRTSASLHSVEDEAFLHCSLAFRTLGRLLQHVKASSTAFSA